MPPTNEITAMATDSTPLTNRADEDHVTLEEYGSIAVSVLRKGDEAPIVVHDFNGPMILETDTLQRRESFAETLSVISDEEQHLILPSDADVLGQATIASEIANLTKNLVGCGVLSLSGGISLCADSPQALWSANLWILALGAIFGYFCFLIAKVCDMTGRTTYRGIWQETIGRSGAGAVSLANSLKAAMANLAYASICSDIAVSLFSSMGLQVPRVVCLLLVTIVVFLPLCLLKNLHVLAPFSVLGTAGICLTTMAMAFRYFDGSYLPGGKFHNDIDTSLQPSFGTTNKAWTAAIFPFVCMTYESYVMHYNSCRFYAELKDQSLCRFAIAVAASFGISAVLYMGIASVGFLTFGANSASFILNNYSPNDPLATVSRLMVGLSTLMAYPIVFHGVRDGVLDVLEVPFHEQTKSNLNRLTLLLLTTLTVIAMFVTDLGLINAVGGGLVATAIVFVFPTMMFRVAQNQWDEKTSNNSIELTFASTLTGFGMVVGVIGSYLAVTGKAAS